MSQTHDQQRFTISEVAADWHESMMPQRIMQPSIARANGQLDPRCSQQTHHRPNRPSSRSRSYYSFISRSYECQACECDYTYCSNAFEYGLVDVGEDVGFRVAENLEGDCAVVVFQRRYIVVAYCQLGARVDLVTSKVNNPSNILRAGFSKQLTSGKS